MSNVTEKDLHRQKYWQGQRLRSQDLSSQITTAAQLRMWHNRALHNSYGIVGGLDVEIQGQNAVVSAGLAYDCRGRLLYLLHDEVIPIPVEGDFVLLLQYEEESHSCKTSTNDHCKHDSAARLCWKRMDHVQIKDGVPLAKLTYAEANQTPILDPVSSKTRGFHRPHISFGTSIPGTGWELWNLKFSEREANIGLQNRIDTTSGGFTRTPYYFAWLKQAPALSEIEVKQRYWILLSFLFHRLDEVSADGFTLQLPIPFQRASGAILDLIQEHELSIFWIGVQPHSEPAVTRRKVHGHH